MPFFDRFFGPPNIAKLKQRGDFSGLLKALGYSGGSPEDAKRIRRQAQEALLSFGEAALEPAATFYLYKDSGVEPKVVILLLREIGRRAADPAVRLRVTEKLADLMDLRKEHRGMLLQAIFTLICQPNPLTYYATTRKILTHWTQETGSRLVQAESVLGMLVSSLQMRDYQSVDRLFDQIIAWTRDDPTVAQRASNALREAAGHLHDEYLMDKTVGLLLQIAACWADRKPIREAATAALAAYPVTSVTRLLGRIEANPKDSFAREALITIGQHVKGGPNEALVIDRLRPALDHADWDVRQTVAQVLRSIPWVPREERVKAELLAAARDFSFSSWSEIQITRDIIERLAALADDPRYPARVDMVRHLALLPSHISDREARFRLRGVLARALVFQPPQLQKTIVRGLVELEWQPGSDANAAVYWVYQSNWEKAAMVGAAGVDALIKVLSSPDKEPRRAAARALAMIYQYGNIDPLVAGRILSARSQMAEHSDQVHVDHKGETTETCAEHIDRYDHSDETLGFLGS